MQIIEDYTQLKFVDQRYEYIGVGFTRSNLFNITHENMYDLCKNLTTDKKKLFGFIWDNSYDSAVVTGIKDRYKVVPCKYERDKVIQWFERRNFEYIFLPPSDFVYNILNDPLYDIAYNDVCKIFDEKKYSDILGVFNKDRVEKWIKFVLTKNYLFFGGVIQPRVFNRTDVLLAPDGTWGYVYYNFFSTYCFTNCGLIPIIRVSCGLPFDPVIENLDINKKREIYGLAPFFQQFRNSYDRERLEADIKNYLSRPLVKYPLRVKTIEYFNHALTFNKTIIRLVLEGNKILFPEYNEKETYRIWEYDNGI